MRWRKARIQETDSKCLGLECAQGGGGRQGNSGRVCGTKSHQALGAQSGVLCFFFSAVGSFDALG